MKKDTIKVGNKVYTRKQIQESIKHWQKVLESMGNGKWYCIINYAHVTDNNMIMLFPTSEKMINKASEIISWLIDQEDTGDKELVNKAKTFALQAYNEHKYIYWTDFISDDLRQFLIEIPEEDKDQILIRLKGIEAMSSDVELDNKPDGSIEFFGYGNEDFCNLQDEIVAKNGLDKAQKIDISSEQ